MNKTIWALAFVVLACGVSFAITNATATAGTQSKYTGTATAGNYTTEGGNVTDVNLFSNASTEKWAGIYGNVTGQLVLTEQANTAYMYSWTYDSDMGGTVCASTGPNLVWTTIGAVAGSAIDAAWVFATTDADSASSTMTDTTSTVIINGVPTTPSANVTTTGGWDTVAVDTGVVGAKNAIAFCVAIDGTGSAFTGSPADFQVMVPTNETAATYEQYFFYVELA